MFRLKIKNWFQKDENYEEKIVSVDGTVIGYICNETYMSSIKPYDMEKWKDGKLYEFKTLKEVKNFIDSCDIQFTDECVNSFSEWGWQELDMDYYIDDSEENLIIFSISTHQEWRD